MNLLYIANANSIHTRRWIEPFVERGHNVHLLSYKSVDRPINDVNLVDLTEILNIPKARFVFWGWWVKRYIHRLQPDILHAHQVQAAGWLGAIAEYHPFVINGWGSDILVEPHRSPLRKLLTKLVLRRCDKLIVPSQHLYDSAKALGACDSILQLIPWGIDTQVFRPPSNGASVIRQELGIPPKAKVVLCPRGILPVYNIDIVIEAIYALITTQNLELKLILLLKGVDQSYLSTLEQAISASELEDNVIWLPFQESRSSMAKLYQISDAVISIPSSEGYGLTVYEAMATGCPTLISDLPVFAKELVNEIHTLKVPVRDVTQTVQSLHRLLTDSKLQQRLQKNGFRIVQEKSIEERIEATNDLYEELISKNPFRRAAAPKKL